LGVFGVEKKFEAPINFDREVYEEKAKEPVFRSTRKGCYYCIIRVGKSFKTLGQVSQFEEHTERMKDTPNANPAIQNKLLIADKKLADKIKEYTADTRYNTNYTTIARELLLTASPDFFKGIPPSELDMWVNTNINWLKNKYGDNIMYATLHLDESTPHIHVLLCPKIYSEARKCYVLSSKHYFGDKLKLRQLQDDYSKCMSSVFAALNRGIRNSKARHIEIKHFYGILNSVKSMENSDIILKQDILLKAKIKALESTLLAYKQLAEDKEKNTLEVNKLNLELSKQVKDIKKDRDTYKDVVKELSQRYKLPQNAIEKVIKYCQNKDLER
jgi:hypothetical protein